MQISLPLGSLFSSLHFWASAAPFYLGYFALYPRIACVGYVYCGLACLESHTSDWAGTLWDGLTGL